MGLEVENEGHFQIKPITSVNLQSLTPPEQQLHMRKVFLRALCFLKLSCGVSFLKLILSDRENVPP